MSTQSRLETDSLGSRDVPADAYWGISTLRAMENFPVSGHPVGTLREVVWALGAIKLAAARANEELGLLDAERSAAIQEACRQIMDGDFDGAFAVDCIQGGAGTSTNMNANEVIANRALELLGHGLGDYGKLDPIDHVNRSQSTNDTYPTAIKLALHRSIEALCTTHAELGTAFRTKGTEFAGILKVGRTQLQDAVPMTLGQEFTAFADTLTEDNQRLRELLPHLREINLGATAIGTGITAPAGYRAAVVRELRAITGLDLASATNLIEATSDAGVFLLVSGILKRAAVKLSKICNDLRLLASGPQAGFAELILPPVQAGSSIMPGKVNPVIPEMVSQVAYRVVGADAAVTMAVEAGQLQLNAFEPMMAQTLLEVLDWLTNACRILRSHCVDGIKANEPVLRHRMEASLGVATGLTPLLGYAVSAALVKEAMSTGRGILTLVRERGLLGEEELAHAISPTALAGI